MVLQQGRSQQKHPIKTTLASPLASHIPARDRFPWYHLIGGSVLALLSLGAFTASPSLAQSSADSTSDRPSSSLPLPVGLGIVGGSGAISVGALALADHQRRAKQRSILQKQGLETELAEAIVQQENLEAKLEGAIAQQNNLETKLEAAIAQLELRDQRRCQLAHRNTHNQLKQHQDEIERLLAQIQKASDHEKNLRQDLAQEKALTIKLREAEKEYQEQLSQERKTTAALRKQIKVLAGERQQNRSSIAFTSHTNATYTHLSPFHLDYDYPTHIILTSSETDSYLDEHKSIVRDALDEGLKNVISDEDRKTGTPFRRPDVLQSILASYQQWSVGAKSEVPELILYSSESDLYEKEHRSIVREALRLGLKKVASGGDRNSTQCIRRETILRGILKLNDWGKENERRRKIVRKVLDGYTGLRSKNKSALMEIGISITSQNKHYKLCFENDDRYIDSLAVSPSDKRHGGKNAARDILKRFF